MRSEREAEQYGGGRERIPMAENLSSMPRSQRVVVFVNVGLLFSIAVSVVAMLPVQFPFIDRQQLRLAAGIAVIAFLDVSFWLAGWPGSALGITAFGIVLAFSAVIGRGLGLAGAALSFLMSILAVLLMLSDIPTLKDGEWVSRGNLPTYIGLSATVILTVLGIALWSAFGGVTYGF